MEFVLILYLFCFIFLLVGLKLKIIFEYHVVVQFCMYSGDFTSVDTLYQSNYCYSNNRFHEHSFRNKAASTGAPTVATRFSAGYFLFEYLKYINNNNFTFSSLLAISNIPTQHLKNWEVWFRGIKIPSTSTWISG